MKLTNLNILATTVYNPDLNRFHPAIRNNLTVSYWHEVSCLSEDEAHQTARATIQTVLDAANKVVEAWNLKTVGE